MALSLPPPSRVAIGSVLFQGQRLEVFLDPEWARYLNSLNTQVVGIAGAVGMPGAPGTTGAAGAAVSFAAEGGGEDDAQFIPGPPGIAGPAGDPGPVIFLEADQPVEFVPGPVGPQGPKGDCGPVIFLMQEPEDNDVFWPIRNS